MDARTLFQEGVIAVRDHKDLAKGRELLMQALKQEPDNELAWLWLSKTTNDPAKKLQCLERALRINPGNDQTRALIDRLNQQAERATNQGHTTTAAMAAAVTAAPIALDELRPRPETVLAPTLLDESPPVAPEPARPKAPARATPSRGLEIKGYLDKAQSHLRQNQLEDAIEQWVRILEIEPDHEVALGNAVRYLSKLKYIDDAEELVRHAIASGTTHPSVYLTAIDIARVQNNTGEADELRLKLVQLPDVSDKMIMDVYEHFMRHQQDRQALEVLDSAAPMHPKNQHMAFLRAELAERLGMAEEAMTYYEQVIKLGGHTKEAKLADKKLTKVAPVVADKERGSIWLAVRESIGVTLLYLLLAWQDAGINLLRLGPGRWLGVVLSWLGAYLLITATSSPQQQPLAAMLGGQVPAPKTPKKQREAWEEPEIIRVEKPTELPIIPTGIRWAFGAAGVVLLALAFWLVFNTSINLLINPNPAQYFVPNICDLSPEFCEALEALN